MDMRTNELRTRMRLLATAFVALVVFGSFLLLWVAWSLNIWRGPHSIAFFVIMFGGMVANVVGVLGLFWLVSTSIHERSRTALAGLGIISLGVLIGLVNLFGDAISVEEPFEYLGLIMSGWGFEIAAGIGLIGYAFVK